LQPTTIGLPTTPNKTDVEKVTGICICERAFEKNIDCYDSKSGGN
jgi:hypothetical protein